MTKQTLDAKIKKRAAQQVDEAVSKFRRALYAAAFELENGRPYPGGYNDANTSSSGLSRYRDLFQSAVEGGKTTWRRELWETREASITEEVMSFMDAIQRVLLAGAAPQENFPDTEVEETK